MGLVVCARVAGGCNGGRGPANDIAAGAGRHLQAHGHLTALPLLLCARSAGLPPLPGMCGEQPCRTARTSQLQVFGYLMHTAALLRQLLALVAGMFVDAFQSTQLCSCLILEVLIIYAAFCCCVPVCT